MLTPARDSDPNKRFRAAAYPKFAGKQKVETSAEMLFGKNADAIPLSARLLGVFGYCGIVAMLADSAPKRSSIRRRARRSRRRMMYWCGRSGRERLTEG